MVAMATATMETATTVAMTTAGAVAVTIRIILIIRTIRSIVVRSLVAMNRGAQSHRQSHDGKSRAVPIHRERNRAEIRPAKRRAAAAMSRKCGDANPDRST